MLACCHRVKAVRAGVLSELLAAEVNLASVSQPMGVQGSTETGQKNLRQMTF